MIEPSRTLDGGSPTENQPQANSKSPSSHGVGKVFVAIGLGGIVGLALAVGDWVSAAFLLLVLGMSVRGYLLGAMKIASGILGLLAAIKWAPILSPYLAEVPQLINVADRWNQVPETPREFIVVLSAGLLIGVLVMSLIRVLASSLHRSKPRWKWVDSWLGATFGGIEGVVLSALIVFTALMLEPIARKQLEKGSHEGAENFSHVWAQGVVTLTRSVLKSSAGKFLNSLEPLRVRFNQQMESMTQDTQGDAAHDTFQGSLRRMIEQMKNDPAARSELAEKTKLDDQSLQSLLDSQEFNQTLNKFLIGD